MPAVLLQSSSEEESVLLVQEEMVVSGVFAYFESWRFHYVFLLSTIRTTLCLAPKLNVPPC